MHYKAKGFIHLSELNNSESYIPIYVHFTSKKLSEGYRELTAGFLPSALLTFQAREPFALGLSHALWNVQQRPSPLPTSCQQHPPDFDKGKCLQTLPNIRA